MARPKCCRTIGKRPACRGFKPVGVPASAFGEIVLSMDEFEAIRLADQLGLYQEQAAGRMNVSRQTFGRIVQTARRKVAHALVEGFALRVEGGAIRIPEDRIFECNQCMATWGLPYGTGTPEECPKCRSTSIQKTEHGGDSSETRVTRRRDEQRKRTH